METEKPEIYKAYDLVFDNEKINNIKELLNKANKKLDEINTFQNKKIQAYLKYAHLFLIDKKKTSTFTNNKYRISYKNGLEERYSWNNTWHEYSIGGYDTKKDIDTIKQFSTLFTEEGINILNTILSFNPEISIKSKRIKAGIIQPYHKEYFYLPSYTQGKNDYPINIIIKQSYRTLGINIPAFHRYSISSAYQTDAESLKRNMLLSEYYDIIMEHLKPIADDIEKRYNELDKNKQIINSKTAKYELLIKI